MTASLITIAEQHGLTLKQLARAAWLYANSVATPEERMTISEYEWINRFNELPVSIKEQFIFNAAPYRGAP